MGKLIGELESVQRRLEALARAHQVPGASLAILEGDLLLEFVTGVTNVRTGVEVTPEALFQIGSNTKLYTATLVMQLVDDGLLDLDEPVRTYLSDFKVADSDASSTITVRHLLTHTSGIQGDHFQDFGRGDDSLAAYAASLAELTQVAAPGALFSYCNSGFTLAGYLVERLRGKPYHEVLRERILAPLGCESTTVLAEEMLAHRYSVGHVGGPGGPVVSPTVLMARASAPAGSVTSATAKDVLRFVTMHLDGGKAPDGTQVLGAASVAAMQTASQPIPGPVLGRHVGLGWLLDEWSGARVIGHGGGTVGQLSFLHALPDSRFAVCLLTNSMTGGALWRDLGRWLFSELAGVSIPEPPRPSGPAPQLDLRRYAGRYERLGVTTDIVVGDGGLDRTMTPTGPMAAMGLPPQTSHLTAIDAETFYTKGPAGESVVSFIEFDKAGRPGFIFDGRATPRTGPAKSPAKGTGTSRVRDAAKAAAKTAAKKPAKATAAKSGGPGSTARKG